MSEVNDNVLALVRAHNKSRDTRSAAIECYERLGMPGTDCEAYRFTDMARMLPVRSIHKTAANTPKAGADGHIRIMDGRLATPPEANAHFSIAETGIDNAPDAFESVAPGVSDGMVALNTSLAEACIHLHIKSATALDAPLVVDIDFTAAPGQLVSPRLLLTSGVDSEARIVLRQTSRTAASVNMVTEVHLAEHARLEVVTIQDFAPDAAVVNGLYCAQEADTTLRLTLASLGCRLTRNSVEASFDGERSHLDLNGICLTQGSQHTDNHTRIRHLKPGCTSGELFKGILGGQSTAAFTGMVLVADNAQKTEALQTNRNLLLSPQAKADTRPQLEIYADDVRCSHGATVGQLDAEQLFYMQARGISLDLARRLLTEAFAADVIERIGDETTRATVREAIGTRLETLTQQ